MRLTHLNSLPRAQHRFIELMYARAVRELPAGNEWLYEVKLDGYRCLAAKTQNGVTLWSRRGNVFNAQFPSIARACERLPAGTLVDGEIVALDERGRISFNLLQNQRAAARMLQFYGFDLLIYRGKSLLNVPLRERRGLLQKALSARVLNGSHQHIRFSEHFEADPSELIAAAKEMRFEGIIAKRKDSRYEPGKRSGAWVKYKLNQSQEFVIGGYTAGSPFEALVIRYYAQGKLLFASKVRNGFAPRQRQELARRFEALQTKRCPFANLPERKRTPWALTAEGMKECRWLKPQLVAQIEFTEWTPDGHLRQPSFIGLRDDKAPAEVTRE